MKKVLFVIAVTGVWLASKIKLSEPPTLTNPRLIIAVHENGLLDVTLYDQDQEVETFFVDNEQQLRDYLKQQYNANFHWE